MSGLGGKIAGKRKDLGMTQLDLAEKLSVTRQTVSRWEAGTAMPDIVMYGNTRHGSNTILDVDGEWMLVRVCTPRGEKEKLIRLGSVRSIRPAEP